MRTMTPISNFRIAYTICFAIMILLPQIGESESLFTSEIDSIIKQKRINLCYNSNVLNYDTLPQMHYDNLYFNAFGELSSMLRGIIKKDLKRAVYLVENSYLSGTIDYKLFNNFIKNEAKKINRYIDERNIRKYRTCVNAALFDYFTKETWMNGYSAFVYDVIDPGGQDDIRKLFVTKLIKTHSGQCFSLPLYYKILCNEMQGTAHLAFCPNHAYIKHIGEDGKWYNVELTSKSFARDEWYMASMNISTEAIKNSVFLSALSEEEEIEYMLIWLAETYKFKYTDYDYFTYICAETVLSNSPTNCFALYLKLQTLQQWGYDYIHCIGDITSTYFKSIYEERNNVRDKLKQLGFSTITTQDYIKNVEDGLRQLGLDTSTNWEKFKKYSE